MTQVGSRRRKTTNDFMKLDIQTKQTSYIVIIFDKNDLASKVAAVDETWVTIVKDSKSKPNDFIEFGIQPIIIYESIGLSRPPGILMIY